MQIKFLFHTKYDLPDSDTFNEATSVLISNNTSEVHKIVIRKKISTRESTRSMPCTFHERKTCQSIEANMLILNHFNCQIPILYHGKHLDNIIPTDVPECSHEITETGLNLLSTKDTNCTMQKACEITRFTSVYQIQEYSTKDRNVIAIVYGTPEVERHNTYVSYDFLSLVGEVGGILGLTLGFSALSLTDSLFQFIPYY